MPRSGGSWGGSSAGGGVVGSVEAAGPGVFSPLGDAEGAIDPDGFGEAPEEGSTLGEAEALDEGDGLGDPEGCAVVVAEGVALAVDSGLVTAWAGLTSPE